MYVFPLFLFFLFCIYILLRLVLLIPSLPTSRITRVERVGHKTKLLLSFSTIEFSSSPFCVPKRPNKKKPQKTGTIFFYRFDFVLFFVCVCFSCVPVNKLNSRKLPVSSRVLHFVRRLKKNPSGRHK